MGLNLLDNVSIVVQLILLALILMSQGITLFILGKKYDKNAWLWGIIGLIQFPLPSIFFYLLIVRPRRYK